MQALAGQATIQAGQGIYPDTTHLGEADGFGRACLPLQIGDSIRPYTDAPETYVPTTVNR